MSDTIAIITDSACDLSESYINQCENLYILPLRLNYEDGSYRCGIDISSSDVLARMEKGEVPKTSLPYPGEVEEVFESLKSKGIGKAVFVMMSSGLSGTFNMVRMMCDAHKDDMKTIVYDSRILSMGLGYMVMNAVELIKAGTPFEDLEEKLIQKRRDVDGLFYLSTLSYLSVGGRIGNVAKYVGNLMNIKPIISCNEEGKYFPRGIGIGAKRTMGMVRDIATEFVGARKAEITMLYTGTDADADRLIDLIRAPLPEVRFEKRELSPALTVHVGPGMVAMCARREAE